MKSKLLLAALLLTATGSNAQVATPTMGWSSWNTFAVNISEDIIKGQADAMVKQGLKDAGYEYINIDDGFQYGRTDDGKVRIHPKRFPNGLLVVSDYIHSKGLKAGIYSDAGDCTCGSMGSGDVQNTNVGFYGHEQKDADFYFIENNFDFIKVDYCGGIHLGINEKEQYSKISQAIKNTGKDVRYNLCRWAYPGTWCSDISTSWRTTGDIYNGWESIRDIIDENLYLSAYCRNGAYNDMDMLEVGRSLSPEEDQTHFGMWCIMASPLLIGCNMETIKPAALSLLKNKELIALNQDPLGLQAYVVQHFGETYVLAKDILNLHGTTRAVALYNPSDKEATITITASELDLAGKATVRNLINHEDIIKNEDFTAMTMKVPAHGTRFLRIDAERRIDRYVYEAETAYLSEYQEIYNNVSAGTAIYQSSASANGGKYAGWLGNKASNDIQWQDVYVEEGGEYMLHFKVATQESRSFKVNVNGVDNGTITAQTNGWEAFEEYNTIVNLKAGSNIIRLYNGSGWMPNIDCMMIEKAGSTSIINRRLAEYAARLKDAAETTGLKNKAGELIALCEGKLCIDEKKALINEMNALMDVIVQVGNVCTDFAKWKNNAQQNISRIADNEALTTFAEMIPLTETAIDAADNFTTANKALESFKTAYKAFLKNSDVKPMEGQALDMSYLIINFDCSAGNGWNGQPIYRSGCGQEDDKTFDMNQTLTDMKPGVYTIRCNAFYRIGDNDGGAAYKAGTEVIPTVFYANNKSTKVKSLYSEEWKEAGEYSGMDNLNGYPHSMHAAALLFAEGRYENKIELRLDAKSNIKIGLKCNENKRRSWCCFDNFSIEYKPLPQTTGIATAEKTISNANVPL